MSTDAPGAYADQPPPIEVFKQQSGKVLRIAAMVKELVVELHAEPLDAASRHRLRSIHARTIRELQDGLAPDLREELQRLALPLTEDAEPSDAELRIAQAQLMGWLEGLDHGIQTAVACQQLAATAQTRTDTPSPLIGPNMLRPMI